MGSVLDTEPKPDTLPVGTVCDTAAQSCNAFANSPQVSSSESPDSSKPVLAPSLQIRTGSDNILFSSVCPTWEDKISQAPVIHLPSKSFEPPANESKNEPQKTKANYIGARNAGPEVDTEAIPTELAEVHALNRHEAQNVVSKVNPTSKPELSQNPITNKLQILHTGNGNTSSRVNNGQLQTKLSSKQAIPTISSQQNNSRSNSVNNSQSPQQLLKLPRFDSSMQIAGIGTRGSGTCKTGTAVLGHAELGQRFWDMRNWDSGSGTCGTGTVFVIVCMKRM